MPGPGNPLIAFRLEEDKAKLFRQVCGLCGWVEPGDCLREFIDHVINRDHGKIHGMLRWVDRAVGVQMDLELMSKPGGPVVPQKRVMRANRAKVRARGGSPP